MSGQKVEAKFRLSDGPILVFIDDIHERVDYPPARAALWDSLSQELLARGATKRVVPLETLNALRTSLPDFDKRGAREIGELAGADQVLWVEIQDFLAEEEISDSSQAAYMAATVKVINARESTSKSRVRLWPISFEGHAVAAQLTGAAVAQAKTKDGIMRVLCEKLADEISRLFYDHELDAYGVPQ